MVHGFIHQMENLLFHNKSDVIIPDLVLNLCILFYAFIDRFDPKCIGKSMRLNEETQCINKVDTGSRSAFLTKEFESGLRKWTFQINKCLHSKVDECMWRQTIGIYRINVDSDDYKRPFPIHT